MSSLPFLKELKSADLLPPLTFPSSWSEKDSKTKSPTASKSRSRSSSPASRSSKKEVDSSELATESQKMALRSLMMEHPEVSEAMKALPSLPKEMPKEMYEAKKLQFAVELAKAVPMDLVLMVLMFIARIVDTVIRQLMSLNTDVNAEYEKDAALQKSMRTHLALWLGDYLNSYFLMAMKLFVVHPWAAIKAGTPVAPSQTSAATAAAAGAKSSSKSVSISSSGSLPPPPSSSTQAVK